jgi:hypothetical protein
MEIMVTINEFNESEGMHFNWEYGHSVRIRSVDERVIIEANEAGLVSLANHLLTLAQKRVPSGYDFHLDGSNGLEEGSCEIVFEKT